MNRARAFLALTLLVSAVTSCAFPGPSVITVDQPALRELTGVYRGSDGTFVYLQMWDEFAGFVKPKQLVAVDESGDIRVLYPTARDQFFVGPGASVSTSIESRIAFQRDSSGRIVSLTWTPAATTGAREAMTARMGPAPSHFPATADDPYWNTLRRTYFFDPAYTLRQLRTPVLAIFGELDNNIVAEKNRAAWEAALRAGGHPDFTLTVLPKGNHLQLEAIVGSNAEMPALKRFVPEYAATIRQWLAKRVRGFDGTGARAIPTSSPAPRAARSDRESPRALQRGAHTALTT